MRVKIKGVRTKHGVHSGQPRSQNRLSAQRIFKNLGGEIIFVPMSCGAGIDQHIPGLGSAEAIILGWQAAVKPQA